MKVNGIHREEGRTKYFRLDDGRIVPVDECIELIRGGQIENCVVSKSKTGKAFIKQRQRNHKISEFELF